MTVTIVPILKTLYVFLFEFTKSTHCQTFVASDTKLRIFIQYRSIELQLTHLIRVSYMYTYTTVATCVTKSRWNVRYIMYTGVEADICLMHGSQSKLQLPVDALVLAQSLFFKLQKTTTIHFDYFLGRQVDSEGALIKYYQVILILYKTQHFLIKLIEKYKGAHAITVE